MTPYMHADGTHGWWREWQHYGDFVAMGEDYAEAHQYPTAVAAKLGIITAED